MEITISLLLHTQKSSKSILNSNIPTIKANQFKYHSHILINYKTLSFLYVCVEKGCHSGLHFLK